MSTVQILFNQFQDTMPIPEKWQKSLKEYAKERNVSITGNLNTTHIAVYKNIMDAIRCRRNVELIPQKKKYFYVAGNIVENRWRVWETQHTNLLDMVDVEDGVIWEGDELNVLSNNLQVLTDKAKKAFNEADANKGDVVICIHEKYECVDYGVLNFLETQNRVYALIEQSLLPNGTESTTEEIKTAVFDQKSYDFDIVEKEILILTETATNK